MKGSDSYYWVEFSEYAFPWQSGFKDYELKVTNASYWAAIHGIPIIKRYYKTHVTADNVKAYWGPEYLPKAFGFQTEEQATLFKLSCDI